MDEPTLFEWAGGREAIGRLIDAFYDRVDDDDPLSPFFPGGVSTAHRQHVTDWWCEVFGGPTTYTDERGGYRTMLAHHLDLGITPEFRAALVGYLEWGTRLAMQNSQPGADVVPDAPVPAWGWGVAPPYQP